MGIYKYEKKFVSTYKYSKKYVAKIWKYMNIHVLG